MGKSYSGAVQSVYAECTDKLLQNIARHVTLAFKEGKTGALDWDVYLLREMGKLTQENVKIIAASTQNALGLAEKEISEAMIKALAKSSPTLAKAAAAGLLVKPKTAAMSSSMSNILKSAMSQIKGTLSETNKMMLQSSLNGLRHIAASAKSSQGYLRVTSLWALERATGEVVTGVSSRQAAVRGALKELAEKGITGFVDKAGRTWSPEAYVAMDVRTTAAGAAMDAVMRQNEAYGIDLVIVPVNATARPKCAPWQGKILSMSGGSGYTHDRDGNVLRYVDAWDTSYGQPDGLFGINCHHRPPDPFIPGFSKANDEPPPDVAERYEQTQQQRKLERDVRAAKRAATMLDAAGDSEGFEEAAAKVKERTGKLKAYCEANGLPFRGDRAQVFGYNRAVSAKAQAAAKKYAAKPRVPKPRAVKVQEVVYLDLKTKREADDYLRPIAGKMWNGLTKMEQNAIYDYTCGSGSFNRPLRGYDEDWSNFVGEGKVPLNNEGKEARIKLLQQVIDRNELPAPMMLYRDSNASALEGLLGLDHGKGRVQYVEEIAKAAIGQKRRDAGFLSTAATVDSDFGGRVFYIIKAPKGTKGIYVEPVSHYNAVKNYGRWDGVSGADRLGDEMEIILQQGNRYMINNVYVGTSGRGAGKLTVEMEVIVE